MGAMQVVLPNGRASAQKGRAPRGVSASPEDDPDLYSWELICLGQANVKELGTYSGLVSNSQNWLSRMRSRGFGHPSRQKKYPTFKELQTVEAEALVSRWGTATKAADKTLWTKGKPKASEGFLRPLHHNHPGH